MRVGRLGSDEDEFHLRRDPIRLPLVSSSARRAFLPLSLGAWKSHHEMCQPILNKRNVFVSAWQPDRPSVRSSRPSPRPGPRLPAAARGTALSCRRGISSVALGAAAPCRRAAGPQVRKRAGRVYPLHCRTARTALSCVQSASARGEASSGTTRTSERPAEKGKGARVRSRVFCLAGYLGNHQLTP